MELFAGQPGDQYRREVVRVKLLEVRADNGAQRVTVPGVVHHCREAFGAGLGHLECFGQQVSEVEHFDVVPAERLCELVVLFLCPPDPRNSVEEQLVVVPRRQPLQFSSRTMQ